MRTIRGTSVGHSMECDIAAIGARQRWRGSRPFWYMCMRISD
eukprot:CAMPEP_0183428412 /NCGR_PEP_ID=MMETSP0370-20130417/44393_1 /TAXON_ID=268820 /ORGANISM="Peridinium aciculiferum, Strain PAER-2" /LENGTH=41 /DNA_ID= /DNA_START= /DNA_END= /DNA_ORIENTATION=